MSFIDNAKRAFSTRADEFYEDDRDEYEEYEDEYEDTPRKPFFSFLKRDEEDIYEEETRTERRTSPTRERFIPSFERTAPTPTPSKVNLAGAELVVHYPESFDDAVKIIREVKANRITVFDISTITSDEEARRIVDYIGGAAEGMECPFQRLCPSIFCIAPSGVKFDIKKRY